MLYQLSYSRETDRIDSTVRGGWERSIEGVGRRFDRAGEPRAGVHGIGPDGPL
jgi:hypothetical protein